MFTLYTEDERSEEGQAGGFKRLVPNCPFLAAIVIWRNKLSAQ